MPRQTKAKRYRRKSRLSRHRRGGMPSQADVTAALDALNEVSVLCNHPSASDRITTIRAVLQSIYPQHQAPVAQAAAAVPPLTPLKPITREEQEENSRIPWGTSTYFGESSGPG